MERINHGGPANHHFNLEVTDRVTLLVSGKHLITSYSKLTASIFRKSHASRGANDHAGSTWVGSMRVFTSRR